MKILWPYGRDRFIPVDRQRHNLFQSDTTQLSQTDLLVLLQELEAIVGEFGDLNPNSHEYRIARIESLLGLSPPVPEAEVVIPPPGPVAPDGYEYLRDVNGNIIYDSLGNPILVPIA